VQVLNKDESLVRNTLFYHKAADGTIEVKGEIMNTTRCADKEHEVVALHKPL